MRIFALRDEFDEPQKDLAYLIYYEKDRKFFIELPEDADVWETPIILSTFVERGEKTVNAYWSKIWVRQRIVPTDRQNLGQILRDNGLELYDEFSLLMLCNGRCAQDDCFLTEIGYEDLPEAVRLRMKDKVEDVIPLRNFHLLVFFQDGTVKKVDALPLFGDIRTFAPVQGSPEVFQSVSVQTGGYGVCWGDQIILEKEVLYNAGLNVPLSADDFTSFVTHRVVTTAEACEIMDCTRQNIDDLVRRGRLHPVKSGGKTKLFLKSEILQRMW